MKAWEERRDLYTLNIILEKYVPAGYAYQEFED